MYRPFIHVVMTTQDCMIIQCLCTSWMYLDCWGQHEETANSPQHPLFFFAKLESSKQGVMVKKCVMLGQGRCDVRQFHWQAHESFPLIMFLGFTSSSSSECMGKFCSINQCRSQSVATSRIAASTAVFAALQSSKSQVASVHNFAKHC